MNPTLSLILPTYNNRVLASANAHALDKYLSSLGHSFEILIVEDGSDTRERIEQSMLPASARLIQLPINRGKGCAVKAGMLAALGSCRIFTDDDLPYDLSFIPEALRQINEGIHFVGGDRSDPRSKAVVETSTIRRITRYSLAAILRLIAFGTIRDSQCGFKAFSGELAASLFPMLTIDRFGFDVEIYFILRRQGIACKRIPVTYCRAGISSVNALRDGLITAWDICRILGNSAFNRYDLSKLVCFSEVPQAAEPVSE